MEPIVYIGRRIDTTVTRHFSDNWNFEHAIWPTSQATGEARIIESVNITAPTELDAAAKALRSVYQMIDNKEV
jgi:hypothetical protein